MLLNWIHVRSSYVTTSRMTSESLICRSLSRSSDFINPFSQYQNSHCEEAVMNLTVFLCKTIRVQLVDWSDKDR